MGDAVIAPKLDRPFCSALDAVTVVEDMRERGVTLMVSAPVNAAAAYPSGLASGAVVARLQPPDRASRGAGRAGETVLLDGAADQR
jgi:hypothetical protein